MILKREILLSLIWLVIPVLLLGLLIAPLQDAAARNIHAGIQSPLVDDILVNPITGLLTTESGGVVSFTVVLASQPSSAVTLGVSSSDTSEGLVSPDSLTFNPGNWSMKQTITITGTDDSVVDGDILYQIITSPAVSNDPIYNGLDAADVLVTNLDNDAIGITVNPTSSLVTTEAGGVVTFTVLLNAPPGAPVTITLSSSDTTEGTVAPPSLTFDPLNYTVGQVATITGVNDFEDDGDIPYQIITSPAASSDANYNGMDAEDVSITNLDDDAAGITVTPTSGLLTTEAGGTDTFTVVLNSKPGADVTLGLSSSDPSEAVISPLQLTFTPDNWSVAQTATAAGEDDPIDDGDQPFTLVTSPAASGDPTYDGWNPPDISGNNLNDDFTPSAAGDAYLTNAKPDQALRINPPGVLVNDSDANNEPLAAIIMSSPQKGIIDLGIDGSFIYTPTQAYTQVEVDSFSYLASDGVLVSNWAPVEITIDPVEPTIAWISPVSNRGIHEVHDQPVQLIANAADNIAVERVRFFRWDAPSNKYIDIGVVSTSPYQWELDVRTLNYWWNQIFASVTDRAGNSASLEFIWIFRYPPPQIFIPMLLR